MQLQQTKGAFISGISSTHLFVHLECGELGGGVRKYPYHLGPVALVQGEERLLLDDVLQPAKHAEMLVVDRVGLQQDLDAIEWRDGRLRAHAGHT